MKDEDKKKIPMMRANRHDIEKVFGVFACAQTFDEIGKTMEKRIRLIPNGWRDLRMLQVKSNELADALTYTLPVEKLQSMKRMNGHMYFKVSCGMGAAHEPDMCLIEEKELNTLVKAAHEGNCKLCMKTNCNGCELGRTLDHTLTYDREGTPWNEIDMTEVGKK